ncbi:MAG: 2-oxoacid:acceptor oxidoreductase family protein [Deferrisomatales bacterium]|nr:2-oxoacid:acceptor oxidoreductase family protein [Deferrisomatales bacterium]
MREAVRVRFCGTGGQGVLLMGSLLGDAAVRDGLWAGGSSTYGTQARGGACRADVVLAREAADYPHVDEADLLVAMSQEAYAAWLPEVRPDGLVLCDHPPVVPVPGDARLHLRVPATRTAVEALGIRQAANVVLAATAVALTRLIAEEAFTSAVEAGAPPGFRETNRRALAAGFSLGHAARGEAGVALAAWAERLGLPGQEG